MKPFYWESSHGNFGDDLNLWLWDFLLPGLRDVHAETLLVGVGTVLNDQLLPREQHKLVIGSGFGYGNLPDMSNPREWDIRSVRGPKTAAKLGLPPEKGVVDPAVMVAEMPEFQGLGKRHAVSFVPHWESAISGVWAFAAKMAGMHYIDPCGEAKFVIREIAQSDLIIAESMHGAILADAFRVPWVAVSTSSAINSFKWNDWAESLGVTYRPHKIPVSTRAEAKMKNARFWGMGFAAPEESATQTGHHAAPTTAPAPVAEQGGLRQIAKQALAVPAVLGLRQAVKQKPQLSSDSTLAARKARFLEVIDGIRQDYL
ncbi:polysaccharide pyruvyl transferase family protein [Rhizobium paknamense]|uniref:Succinoglycan biosynthesis protein ExoV n=1 Tax=Rhizobium paknamense TaxID=1206817 RepID=A0ABU0IJF0_9HYPH|nr:polysaccharide pyruvyl transferase family protein [Rhizobium paknamense]MDQ0458380.1 succinoglycan biosynthesis protein ExoV [Rhizobium paknamense]